MMDGLNTALQQQVAITHRHNRIEYLADGDAARIKKSAPGIEPIFFLPTMAISPGLRQLCFELDKFQIATAIGHISRDVFVTWNHAFEARLGLDETEMNKVELRNIVVSDAPLVEPSPETERSSGGPGLFSDCVVRIPDGRQVLGRSVQREDGFVLVLLDHVSGDRGAEGYARGYLVGLGEEKERARQIVRENVSGNLLAASFAAENAKQKLEDQERPEAADLRRITYLIDQAINDLVNAFTSEPPIGES
jgi:PAS domain-containing protein